MESLLYQVVYLARVMSVPALATVVLLLMLGEWGVRRHRRRGAEPSIISLALGLFGLAGDPSMPVEPPLGWALLAWVRRQFDRRCSMTPRPSRSGPLPPASPTTRSSRARHRHRSRRRPARLPRSRRTSPRRRHHRSGHRRVHLHAQRRVGRHRRHRHLHRAASELNTETHWHGPIRGILGALFGHATAATPRWPPSP